MESKRVIREQTKNYLNENCKTILEDLIKRLLKTKQEDVVRRLEG